MGYFNTFLLTIVLNFFITVEHAVGNPNECISKLSEDFNNSITFEDCYFHAYQNLVWSSFLNVNIYAYQYMSHIRRHIETRNIFLPTDYCNEATMNYLNNTPLDFSDEIDPQAALNNLLTMFNRECLEDLALYGFTNEDEDEDPKEKIFTFIFQNMTINMITSPDPNPNAVQIPEKTVYRILDYLQHIYNNTSKKSGALDPFSWCIAKYGRQH